MCLGPRSDEASWDGEHVLQCTNGPGSKRRRTLWLRALQRSMDRGESGEDDARPTQDRTLSEGDQ